MTQAVELLEELQSCGVSITVDHGELVLRPGSKVPADLLAQVKEHKPEILSTLRHRTELPKAATNLLSRLQAGSRWLTDQHEQFLIDAPTAASDERFSAALDLWVIMEQTVRQIYGYEGCALGPGEHCPEGAPVTCDSCVPR